MKINEKVIVKTGGDGRTRALVPELISWRNREYPVEKIGLHHTFWRGRERVHVFSVAAGGNFFRLELGTEGLYWFITQVE